MSGQNSFDKAGLYNVQSNATYFGKSSTSFLGGRQVANVKMFLRSGHTPTLLAAFLYFDFSFAIWVLNGAMGPFISDTFKLTPAQTGFMISVPIIAGALMRFPLGVLSQYIGRKNAAILEMSMIFVAMMYGFSW